jgi:hypothetical protein
MKLLSFAFLGLLVWSQHAAGRQLSEQPLSMFRDGEYRAVGYALFGLLLAIGILMLHAQVRARHVGAVIVFGLALVFLVVVVATPSLDATHDACATTLLFLLFVYYAGLLILAQTSWLYAHLAVPLMLMPLLAGGYGPLQKGLIVYLLVLINIHWHLLEGMSPLRHRERQRGPALRRHVIYVVEDGKAWTRRERLGSSCA